MTKSRKESQRFSLINKMDKKELIDQEIERAETAKLDMENIIEKANDGLAVNEIVLKAFKKEKEIY